MLRGERLTVKMGRQQEVVGQRHLDRHVDGEVVFTVLQQVLGCWLELDQATVHQLTDRNPFPLGVELAPAGHAVDVHLQLGARQLLKLFPVPALLLLDLAPDSQVPGLRIELGDRAVVQHRELVGRRLAGR